MTSRSPRMQPLARHAVLERRSFLRGAVASAFAAGGAGALLAACAESSPPVAAPGTSSAPPPAELADPARPWWMQGGFAPVADEHHVTDLEVSGSLPPELSGLYVRNGSNPASGDSGHWFLGDGMVHGVSLGGGGARWYRNRYVDTPFYRTGSGLLDGDGAPGGESNQSNVSAFAHAGELLTSGEIGLPYVLSVEDLSTVGAKDYDGRLTTAMTAHPKIDPVTGAMHFFGYGFVPPYLTYHVASADGVLEHSTPIEVAGPTMIHDFAVTDRDVVFWELPVVFDLDAAMAAVNGDPDAAMPFQWDESYGARLGVMPLGGEGADIRWVEIPPCYVFHGVNAWREGDDVVADVCRMPTMFRQGGDVGDSMPHRWRIGTGGAELTFAEELLEERAMDLPSIDRRFAGRSNRHAWYLRTGPDGEFPIEFEGLAHRDKSTGALDVYDPGPSMRLNEGTFVAASADAGEGEGWLLTYAWDRARQASDLVVLDALDLAAGPVASVHLPTRVPYGFHGTWVPDSA